MMSALKATFRLHDLKILRPKIKKKSKEFAYEVIRISIQKTEFRKDKLTRRHTSSSN
jgi:hypothetical protein